MRAAEHWKDYELLDASSGERLERWGDILLIRPDPQILWETPRTDPRWRKAHARYHRSGTGGGHWERLHALPDVWEIGYEAPEAGLMGLRFRLKPMGFKHTGLFPEQAVNWEAMASLIREAGRPVKVLNLFGYTGGATLACAAAGAQVTHVDASKGMVAWGRENAVLSGLADRPVRWLVDDCGKFVAREQRRGNTYDAIVMDPPSYGRGPGGEVWKLEEQIDGLIGQCAALLSDNPLFFAVNSYTAGLSPSVMQYMLETRLFPRFGGAAFSEEIGLPVTDGGFSPRRVLPCGATALWRAADETDKGVRA